ncbi:hypothetical protein PF005_g7318 [Phytophthora fragariae]|uniref:Uncharacterized protein n=1 Tax=Phytophthora fragariae TaxID=53985 RepID=A0A6A3LEX6_9STRA|nr:hypothetical protein PF003_g40020 [Phytophthora fragariae]KAE8941785.1 hypothetical protein PF009_g8450 [Phytophthora fragariae]KAE9017946.1 hypothetical protein PF011_g6485 [Phytophthora fragariae]KAE9121153.1 hypothetical protein PF007_g7925 [Phytophthora fragariae]KAE9122406.1 hypothetical protein PF010_g6760 [Phytophthora fragariae]
MVALGRSLLLPVGGCAVAANMNLKPTCTWTVNDTVWGQLRTLRWTTLSAVLRVF